VDAPTGRVLPDGDRAITARLQPLLKEDVGPLDTLINGQGIELIAESIADEEMRRAAKLSLEIIGTAGFDGYFKRLNAAAEKILGYSREELLSKPLIEFVHIDDRAATVEAASILALGTDVAHFQNRYHCKDGSYRWLQWQSQSSVAEKLIYFAARDARSPIR
jgi:PAS domain S-box-containing protein